jgi:hypothetical protein
MKESKQWFMAKKSNVNLRRNFLGGIFLNGGHVFLVHFHRRARHVAEKSKYDQAMP